LICGNAPLIKVVDEWAGAEPAQPFNLFLKAASVRLRTALDVPYYHVLSSILVFKRFPFFSHIAIFLQIKSVILMESEAILPDRTPPDLPTK